MARRTAKRMMVPSIIIPQQMEILSILHGEDSRVGKKGKLMVTLSEVLDLERFRYLGLNTRRYIANVRVKYEDHEEIQTLDLQIQKILDKRYERYSAWLKEKNKPITVNGPH